MHITTKISLKKAIWVIGLLVASLLSSIGAKTKEIIFEETVIEGKIKRPQVVLISADQRPLFSPMAINRFVDSASVFERVPKEIFEQNRFEDALDIGIGSKQ